MKIASAEQGAGRYVVGKAERFDQKNEMFCRPLWDPAMLALGKKFYMTAVPPRDKPGYRLMDQALVNAAWHLENTFAQGVAGGRMGMYAWEWEQIFEYPTSASGTKNRYGRPPENNQRHQKGSDFLWRRSGRRVQIGWALGLFFGISAQRPKVLCRTNSRGISICHRPCRRDGL